MKKYTILLLSTVTLVTSVYINVSQALEVEPYKPCESPYDPSYIIKGERWKYLPIKCLIYEEDNSVPDPKWKERRLDDEAFNNERLFIEGSAQKDIMTACVIDKQENPPKPTPDKDIIV